MAAHGDLRRFSSHVQPLLLSPLSRTGLLRGSRAGVWKHAEPKSFASNPRGCECASRTHARAADAADGAADDDDGTDAADADDSG